MMSRTDVSKAGVIGDFNCSPRLSALDKKLVQMFIGQLTGWRRDSGECSV